MAVYDCFTFFNELDMLEVRLTELSGTVDTFVLVESEETFQGNSKPLYFFENRDRYREFLPKIRHVVVPAGKSGSSWDREFHQRGCILNGLRDATDSDTILVSDADEIMKSDSIKEAAANQRFCFLVLDNFIYYMDLSYGVKSYTYAAPYSYIKSMPDLSAPRVLTDRYLDEQNIDRSAAYVQDAGWHMSWLGGTSKVLQKLASFSHTEESVQKWADADRISGEIEAQRFFYNGHVLNRVELATLPNHVQRNAARFLKAGYLCPPTPAG